MGEKILMLAIAIVIIVVLGVVFTAAVSNNVTPAYKMPEVTHGGGHGGGHGEAVEEHGEEAAHDAPEAGHTGVAAPESSHGETPEPSDEGHGEPHTDH